MITTTTRTEYGFRTSYGQISQVLDHCGSGPVGIADRHGTWGHVPFFHACKARGIKPVLGVELAVVHDTDIREKQHICYFQFLARNNEGLKEIYALVTKATGNFYFVPRLDYGDLWHITDNVIIIIGVSPEWSSLLVADRNGLFVGLSPASEPDTLQMVDKYKFQVIATSDNYYPTPTDVPAYEMAVGPKNARDFPWPMHILSEDEYLNLWTLPEAIENMRIMLDVCNVDLPVGEMVRFPDRPVFIRECQAMAMERGVDLSDPVYCERFDHEVGLIIDKKFQDYFLVIADMIAFAKKKMLVGPARGSSCGSLVCYLMGITEIDPIPHGLLFERFIDANRDDLPDIDIDFPDSDREQVFTYLAKKYGVENVARLGTVSRYQARSAIGEVAKALDISPWEVADLKDSIEPRPDGDKRAHFTIFDTFNDTQTGAEYAKRFPGLPVAAQIENHARHSGQHAAGILVTAEPVENFCSVERREPNKPGIAQIDKKDAEKLNLLKIDALGLRTLSILQEVLKEIGWSYEKLYRYPINDQQGFEVLNGKKFAGIFQFEGHASKELTVKMGIRNFEDMIVLVALVRPGPGGSGGIDKFCRRKNEGEIVEYQHPIMEEITKETFGIIIYQEQVMKVVRLLGNLPWKDVSAIRKAGAKSQGKEVIDKFWPEFLKGAISHGLDETVAQSIWLEIISTGNYSFNKSHAVAYALVSYWCCILKARFPLQFAAATLRHAKDDDQAIAILRELSKEGVKHKPVDANLSGLNWTVADGQLLGGLLNVKGLGPGKAKDILKARKEGKDLTPGMKKILEKAETPFDNMFDGERLWGHIKANPEKHNIIHTEIIYIDEISEDQKGLFTIIARLKGKTLRNLNEKKLLDKPDRKGRIMYGQIDFLNLVLEDDTGEIRGSIFVKEYLDYGKDIHETGKLGDWFLFKGKFSPEYRNMSILQVRKLIR